MRPIRGTLRTHWRAISWRAARRSERPILRVTPTRQFESSMPTRRAPCCEVNSLSRAPRLSPMHDHKSERAPAMPWRVPIAVEDIPEDGQTFTLEADAETRAAIAKLAGLR